MHPIFNNLQHMEKKTSNGFAIPKIFEKHHWKTDTLSKEVDE